MVQSLDEAFFSKMYHVCNVYDIDQKDIQETVLVCVLRGRVESKPED